jgi:hypothetical protein
LGVITSNLDNHIKIKLPLFITNQVLCREGVWGSGCIDPHILDLSGARGNVVGSGIMLQAGWSRVPVPIRRTSSIDLIHTASLVDSASNRNEYQESSWGCKGRPARKADYLTAICEPTM